MRDQKIIQMFGEIEKKITMSNMILNKFAHESSHQFNTLVLSFNAVKNLLVEKGVMTDEEINERITLEIEKAQASQDEIMEEPVESEETEELPEFIEPPEDEE